MVLVVKNPPANGGDIRDVGSIPRLGRSPGGGHGNPLRYSCLENPMSREAWWATVHGVAKSRLHKVGLCFLIPGPQPSNPHSEALGASPLPEDHSCLRHCSRLLNWCSGVCPLAEIQLRIQSLASGHCVWDLHGATY